MAPLLAAGGSRYFYPRSPCGERLIQPTRKLGSALFLSTLSLRRATISTRREASESIISIHALLAESDQGLTQTDLANRAISIHALLAESDANWFDLWGWAEYFYPRSPCGERLGATCGPAGGRTFLSTLSLRRATANDQAGQQGQHISIHALLAESDN